MYGKAACCRRERAAASSRPFSSADLGNEPGFWIGLAFSVAIALGVVAGAPSPAPAAQTDTDGDGVPDSFDIDDDNDGARDNVEIKGCAAATRFARITGGAVSDDTTMDTHVSGVMPDGGGFTMSEKDDAIAFSSYSADAAACGFQESTFFNPASAGVGGVTLTVRDDAEEHRFAIDFDAPVRNVKLQVNGVNRRHLIIFGAGLTGVALDRTNGALDIRGNRVYDPTPDAHANDQCRHDAADRRERRGAGSILVRGTYRQINVKLTKTDLKPGDKLTLQITQVCQAGEDSDGDGIADSRDLDSDNDGVPDNIEAQSTRSFRRPNHVYNSFGADSAYTSAITPVDSDRDGTPDFLDLDSDDDGRPDYAESGLGLRDVNGDDRADGVVGANGLVAGAENSDDFADVNGRAFHGARGLFLLADRDGDTRADGGAATPITHDLDYRDVDARPALTPFACDGYSYFTHTGGRRIGRLQFPQNGFLDISAHGAPALNSLGYRARDGYVYGIGDHTLYRIGGNNVAEEIGVLPEPDAMTYALGDFGADGYLHVRRQNSETMHRIDVDAAKVVDAYTLSPNPQALNDIGYSPVDGLFYAAEHAAPFRLLTIDPTSGAVNAVGPHRVSGLNRERSWASIFVDALGRVYGVREDGLRVYRFDRKTGAATALTDGRGPRVRNSDGFFCSRAAFGEIDRSDAPNSFGPALHTLFPGVRLGDAATSDPIAAAIASANADADAGDDGVSVPPLTAGENVQITARVFGDRGYLQGWIDWDVNGVFAPTEQIADDLQDGGPGDLDPAVGTIRFAVAVPADFVERSRIARFRWSTAPGLEARGAAPAIDGEVEDYAIGADPRFDLALAVVPAETPPPAGFATGVSVVVANEGRARAKGVEARVRVGAHLTQLGHDGGDGYDAARGVWNVGALAPGARKTLTLRVAPTGSGADGGDDYAFSAEIVAAGNVDGDGGDADSDPATSFNADDKGDGDGDDDEARADLTPRDGRGVDAPPRVCPAGVSRLDFDDPEVRWPERSLSNQYIVDDAILTLSVNGDANRLVENTPKLRATTGAGEPGSAQTLNLVGHMAAKSDVVVLTIAASRPLDGFSIRALDLDLGVTDLRAIDKITVRGYLGDAETAPALRPVVDAGANISIRGDTAVAVRETEHRTPKADLLIRFLRPVDRVVIEYGVGDAIRVEEPRINGVFISDPTFCKPVQRTAINWRPGHESTATAGARVVYEHRLDVGANLDGGALRFEVESGRGLVWTLHRDRNGDGVYDDGDPAWVDGDPVAAGDDQRFFAVAQVPRDAAGFWVETTTITAHVAAGAGAGPGLGPARATLTNVTRLRRVAEGTVIGVKSMAIDADCDGVADAAFTDAANGLPGDCVIYRIAFRNAGGGVVTNVAVNDATPQWTRYLPGSAVYERVPAGLLPGTAATPGGDGGGPIIFPFTGALAEGGAGVVRFGVRINR